MDRLMGKTQMGVKASILKQVLFDGKYKVFGNTTGDQEKIEISLDNGRSIVFYKEIQLDRQIERFKSMEICEGSSFLEKMDLFASDHFSKSPTYRFYFSQVTIGTGEGDVALVIASKLLGETSPLDPRFLGGSSVDEAVMKEIRRVVENKNF